MHKKETLNYYESKVKNILQYIQNNLDKDLNVKTLAERSNISFFHFHRIVKAYLGEPLGTYINRLRLDTAARLIKYSNDTMGDIAIKIGYSALQAFSESFTMEFGLSPSDYRSDKESIVNSMIDFQYKHEKIEICQAIPKIKTLPMRKVAFIEVKGKYGDPESYKAWEVLFDYAVKNKFIGWNTEAFSIYYDDPDVVGIENCRFDCCITIRKELLPSGPVRIKEIEGGKYLVFHYMGPYEKLWELYDSLYRNIIYLQNKYQIRDSPVIEKYLKYSEKTKSENLVTEVHIPID